LLLSALSVNYTVISVPVDSSHGWPRVTKGWSGSQTSTESWLEATE
jgi:hypothetical protein